MNISALYREIGADYAEVCSRLGSEAALAKFLPRFAQDETFSMLCAAMKEKRLTDAFQAAHTLKGLAANFGFSQLYEYSSALTELLRAGSFLGTDDAFARTEAAYFAIIDAIRKAGFQKA